MKKAWGKVNAEDLELFRNSLVDMSSITVLLITSEQVNTLEVEKKEENNVNNEQNFDQLCSHSETNWSPVL